MGVLYAVLIGHAHDEPPSGLKEPPGLGNNSENCMVGYVLEHFRKDDCVKRFLRDRQLIDVGLDEWDSRGLGAGPRGLRGTDIDLHHFQVAVADDLGQVAFALAEDDGFVAAANGGCP